MTTIDELDRQIAELEETLHLPLRESALQLVRKQLAELQQERARLTGGVQNTVNNSGTIHGSVTGANYGTVQNFFGGMRRK